MVVPNQQSNILQPRNGKCTFAQVQDTGDAHASSSSAMQANPVKRAQTVGESKASKNIESANQQRRDEKGKGKQVGKLEPNNDEDEELSSKAPNKFSESLGIERPEWAASGSSEPANSASQDSYLFVNDADLCTTTGHGLNSAVSTASPSVVPTVTLVHDANLGWPVITKLITPLLHAHKCLIRSEVKERCNTVTMASFLSLGQERNVINYANAPSNLMMCSWPYQNKHIITVIQDMYFTGGSASFAKKYNYLFPIFEGCKGEMIKVPVLMVALVATALYAMIYEWRTGEQQVMEFSANVYLDVYNGHVNTLNHIRDKRPARSMEMMGTLVFPSPNLIWTTLMADHIFVRSQHLPQHKIVPLQQWFFTVS
ncbi:hypothetical protein EI94DRAFT_1701829 [Lactarius quietus]|nr:hypothetical protein EI94DRAFT_1701829 [Lactarius quietus]